ncbi:MAG: ABC transporter substrate-binding protein [Myxococcota bacterium]
MRWTAPHLAARDIALAALLAAGVADPAAAQSPSSDKNERGEDGNTPGQHGPTAVQVLVPSDDNLQFLNLWIAIGADYFADEGLTVQIITPEARPLALQWMRQGKADVAVLPPPMYLALIGEARAGGRDIRVVANLLRSDPINLIVTRATWDRLGADADGPLERRLRALRGLRIGIALHPGPRLSALFATHGLRADEVLDIVPIKGQEQNAALAEGRVAGLYAHSPYLERALVHQDAVVVVDQSSGAVPALADLNIHSLVVSADILRRQPAMVRALVRAIARAQQLAHSDVAAATRAVGADLPDKPPAEIARITALYAPALPHTPRPSLDAMVRTMPLFPIMGAAPPAKAAALAPYVAENLADGLPAQTDSADPAKSDGYPAWATIVATVGAALTVLALGLLWLRRRAR